MPEFDPNKPFTVKSESKGSEEPQFDPSKPFKKKVQKEADGTTKEDISSEDSETASKPLSENGTVPELSKMAPVNQAPDYQVDIKGSNTEKPEINPISTENIGQAISGAEYKGEPQLGKIKEGLYDFAANQLPANLKMGIASISNGLTASGDPSSSLIDLKDAPEVSKAMKKDAVLTKDAADINTAKLGLTQRIGDIKDPYQAIEYVFNTVGQAGVQIPAAIATFGTSSFLQEAGQAYYDNVKQVAKDKGITPAEVIYQGLDNAALSTSVGLVSAALDYVGAGKVLGSIGKQGIAKAIKAISVEGSTEAAQGQIQKLGQIAGSDNRKLSELATVENLKDIGEEFSAGAIGSGGITLAGKLAPSKADLTDIESRDEIISHSPEATQQFVATSIENAPKIVEERLNGTTEPVTTNDNTQGAIAPISTEVSEVNSIPITENVSSEQIADNSNLNIENNDSQNEQQQIPSEIGGEQESQQAESDQGTSGQETESSGILQAPEQINNEGQIQNTDQRTTDNTGGAEQNTDQSGSEIPTSKGSNKEASGGTETAITESSKKDKSVYKNAIARSNIPQETKDILAKDPHYNEFTNDEANSIADGLITESGSVDNALKEFTVDKKIPASVKTKILIKGINQQTEAYDKADTPELKAQAAEKQADYLDLMDEFGRDAGRAIEAIKELYTATPEGIFIKKKRDIRKINKEVSDLENIVSEKEFNDVNKKLSESSQDLAKEKELSNAVEGLKKEIERLNKKIKEDKSKSESDAKKQKGKDLLAEGINDLASLVRLKLSAVDSNPLKGSAAKSALKKISDGIILTTEAKGQELYDKIKNAIKSAFGSKISDDHIDEAINGLDQFKNVWHKERDIIVSSLVNKALGKSNGVVSKTVIQTMSDRIKKLLKEKSGSPNAKSGEGVYQKISDLLKNPEIIDQITKELQNNLVESGLTEEDATHEAGLIYDRIALELDKGTDSIIKDAYSDILKNRENISAFINSTVEDQNKTKEDITNDIIEKMGLSESVAKQYGGILKSAADKAIKRKNIQILDKALNPKKRKGDTKKTRDIEKIYTLINAGALDYSEFKNKLYEKSGIINESDPAVNDKLKKLASNIARSNSDVTRFKAELAMAEYINTLTKGSWVKKGIALSYANMLSSYDTPLRNIGYGLQAVLNSYTDNTANLAWAAVRGNKADIIKATAIYRAMVNASQGKGQVLARDILRTGNALESTEQNVLADELINNQKDIKNGIDWAIDKYQKGMSMAFRNLKAGDAYLSQPIQARLTFSHMFDSRIALEEQLHEQDNSYTKKSYQDIANEINRQLAAKQDNDVLLKAAKEIEKSQDLSEPLMIEDNGTLSYNPFYADKKYNDIKRLHKLASYEFAEKALNIQPEDANDIKTERQEILLMGSPKGDAGIVSAAIGGLFERLPILKMLTVPFVNVPLNAANQVIERSPIGTAIYGSKYIKEAIRQKSINPDIKHGLFFSEKAMVRDGLDPYLSNREKSRILRRQAVSYAFMGTALALSQIKFKDEDDEEVPLIEFTANGKKNWSKNEQIKYGNPDFKEFSAIIYNPVTKNKTTLSYKESPLAAVLIPLGVMNDYQKYGVGSDESQQESIGIKMTLITLAYSEYISETSAMKGMSDMVKSVQDLAINIKDVKDSQRYLEGIGKLFAKKITGLAPLPLGAAKAINQDVNAILDADDKQAKEWYDYAYRDIPMLDNMLTIKYNHFGEPVKQISDIPLIYNGKYKENRYYKEAVDHGYEYKFLTSRNLKNMSNGETEYLSVSQLSDINKLYGDEMKRQLSSPYISDGKKYPSQFDYIMSETNKETTKKGKDQKFRDNMDAIQEHSTDYAKLIYNEQKQIKK